MFEITTSMILVRDGVDGMRHIWMSLGPGCGKKTSQVMPYTLRPRYSLHYIKQYLCYVCIKACEPEYKCLKLLDQ